MRTLRLFLYGIPAALLILLAAAFLNATFLSVAKKNEMSIGTLGEPSTLNPIQQADSASSQVGSLIFNGLIKYNQNLEIVGDLATKWELSQETTFQFATKEEAQHAARVLTTKGSDGASFSTSGIRLIVHLNEPGFAHSEELFHRLIDAGLHHPIHPARWGTLARRSSLYLRRSRLHLPGDHEREGRLTASL